MARRLRIEWRAGSKVTAQLAMPRRPRGVGVLLAHGAGAGQSSWFMATVRDALAAAGYPALTFDYPYIEEGRRRPDQAPKLVECHRAAAERLGSYVREIVLGGKSMGGRIGGHVADDVDAAGLLFYGYPLVAIGGKVRPLDHLATLDMPKLFVAGTRDTMSPLPRLRRAISVLPNAEAALIEGGDHSLNVPKSVGLSQAEILDGVVQITVDWLERL
ncbi:MAG: alpha/beta fold hydrolase [Acidimicrobiia bacterium]|nr:alpha/beta fold hydrolase [Acidimicrobiia bacterium]